MDSELLAQARLRGAAVATRGGAGEQRRIVRMTPGRLGSYAEAE
jgi:hypothetical protein